MSVSATSTALVQATEARSVAAPAHLGEVQPQTFRGLLQGIAGIAGLTHISFLSVFLWAGVMPLAIVNVASVLCYVWIFLLTRQGKVGRAWALTVIEVLAHAVLATFVIGWASGFHHYILLVIPVAVVSPIRPLWVKALLVVFLALTYLGLDMLLRESVPPHSLPTQVLQGLHYFNVFGAMLILTFLAGCYYYLINQAHAALRSMAATDPLTQLHNRRSIMDIMHREESRIRRGQRHLSLLLCDLDHFKSVNDHHGHDAGDMVLKAVSQALTRGVRDVDFLARWGGEEFLVLLPDTDGIGAARVAERLRASVAALQLTSAAGAALQVTLTLGLATLGPGESCEEAIARADNALYDGKRGGRNRVVMAAATAVPHPRDNRLT